MDLKTAAGFGGRLGDPQADLAECKLVSFPIGIYKVLRNVSDQIHLITLANNELKSLTSKFMTTFSQLRVLNLWGKVLKPADVPKQGKENKAGVGDISHLLAYNIEELRLEGNFLHRLPNEVSGLQHLKAIDLSRNQFRDFPEQLTTLLMLETINLEENEIVDVPMEKLATMPALHTVNLRFNPLSAEVRVIAPPLIKFDLLMSPEGARAPPP
ncbi:Leucine-rich repeat-containing protein 20 [Fukomys damarensis]|uniref:Leucine-rich repeat-containing protein 20 n=1 Tax=Fukomys damarensis TaxID=885580 RepID=A0A091E0T4_FUKDA|nr:Leucine-rich repeat-containing protein 20 [Fukomys damarensis]